MVRASAGDGLVAAVGKTRKRCGPRKEPRRIRRIEELGIDLLRVLDATLKPVGTDATIISAAANGQYFPRGVGAPGGAFVAWLDDRLRSTPTTYRSPEADIYGALVTPGSAGLAQTVTQISTSPNTDSDPAVGWDGTRFTIVFRLGLGSSPSGRYLVHVDTTGARAGGMVGPLETTDYSAQSLLTWNGSEYLTAWFDGENSALGAPYEGRRITFGTGLVVRLETIKSAIWLPTGAAAAT